MSCHIITSACQAVLLVKRPAPVLLRRGAHSRRTSNSRHCRTALALALALAPARKGAMPLGCPRCRFNAVTGCDRCNPAYVRKRARVGSEAGALGVLADAMQPRPSTPPPPPMPVPLGLFCARMMPYCPGGSSLRDTVATWGAPSGSARMSLDRLPSYVIDGRLALRRSASHGMGVFARVDLGARERVVEYVGTVVSNAEADRREAAYVAQGLGNYLFRLDDERVIDAMRTGNCARFINHSCAPNCRSVTVTDARGPLVWIETMGPVAAGLELTYDYMMETGGGALCACGAATCRGFM